MMSFHLHGGEKQDDFFKGFALMYEVSGITILRGKIQNFLSKMNPQNMNKHTVLIICTVRRHVLLQNMKLLGAITSSASFCRLLANGSKISGMQCNPVHIYPEVH